MAKRFLLTGLFLLVLLGGIFGAWGWNVYQAMQKFSNYRPPAVSVATTPVVQETWHSKISAIGTLESTHGVTLTPETAGIIKEINVTSGSYVKQGQLLIRLNDDIDQAELRKAEAEAKLAMINYKRQKDLVAKNAAPSSMFDKAAAELQQANAAVQKVKAIIAQKNITAPFSGKLGILNVHLGQFVSPNTTTNMVSLQSMNPLYVRFTIPEQWLSRIKVNQNINIKVSSFKDKLFPGRITAIDAKIDPQTHNVSIQGLIPNGDLLLYPGLFAEVAVDTPEQATVLAIPKVAVTYSLYGDMVYVVVPKNKEKVVERRYVKVGRQNGGKVAITDGLRINEIVVTAGHQKLHDKSRVIIDNKANFK